MLMSQLAMMDLGASGTSLLARCRQAIARFFGFGEVPPELRDVLRPDVDVAALPIQPVLRMHVVRDVPMAPVPAEFRWRRHPLLRSQATSSLPEPERAARAHAIRALYAARAGELDAARCHFALAAAEPSVDLSEIPGFWSLPRAAMLVAVEGYEEAGRLRDAAALGARIRTKLRPRPLTAVPANVTTLPDPKLSVSSGS